MGRAMTTDLLTERQVLNKMDWPCRAYIDRRIKSAGFPKPHTRSHGIGDQWRLDHIDSWLGIEKSKENGEEKLKDRFKKMGAAS